MRKYITSLLFLLACSANAIEDLGVVCDEIQRLRTWAFGSNTYGVWIEFKTNPQNCEGGFYVPHNADNKQLVVSMALAAKAANQRMCIQIGNLSSNIGNRCELNYIMHE